MRSKGKLKLSEAMVRGLKLFPDALQTTGDIVVTDEYGVDCACAEGFIYLGAFGIDGMEYLQKRGDRSAYLVLSREYGTELKSRVKFGAKEDFVDSTIWHLNDDLHWTVPQIAVWLAAKGY